ncbi:MAG: DUF1616 domain-containing protein [Halobacteriota archaeon]|nr:DUF1616 domain-containing protein [Halobacteriota archaeon]
MANSKWIYGLSSDLVLVILFMALSILFTLVSPFNQTPLRIIFSLPILLFLPGYALISAMFPRRSDLSGIERFTLGIGMSIAIFVFDGFAISVTQWRFRPMPLVLSLSMITLILVLITIIVRWRTPKDERFTFNLLTVSNFIDLIRRDTEEPTEIEKALIIALVGSIIIASGILVFAKITFEEEKFTTLYILGEGGKAENYPTDLYLLEPTTITVGVENYEHAPANYTLEVRLEDYLLNREEFWLDHDWKWVHNLSFTPKHVGKNLKLQLLLYKDDLQEPYRSVHLWVDSSIDYDNLKILEAYALSELPQIRNEDMERIGGWTMTNNSLNFRGHLTKFYSFSENSTIFGYVTDNQTGLPVENARISITNRYGYERSNTTNESGYYEMQTIADHFWIESRANGYERSYVNVSVAEDEKFLLNIINEPLITEMPFNLTLEELYLLNLTIETLPLESTEWLYVVEGRVTDYMTGLPIPDAEVNILASGYDLSTTTNDIGYFEMVALPGQSIITTRADGYIEESFEFYISGNSSVDIGLEPKTYVIPGKGAFGLLSNLFSIAKADDETAGLPEWLAIVKGYAIDNVTGSPIPNASIKITSGYGFEKQLTTDRKGYFETRIIAGSSYISADADGYMSKKERFEFSGLASGDVRLEPERSIVRGYIYDNRTGAFIPDADVGVTASGYRARTRTNSTGYYELNIIAGEMVLRANKGGYFWNENEFNVDYLESKTVNMTLNPVPPPSTISGYISYNGTMLPGVEIHVTDRFKYEESTITDGSGYYELEVASGHLWLNVLPSIYADEIEFTIKSGQIVYLDIELRALPESLYQVEYPSETIIEEGYYGGISQEIESDEGLAALSFKMIDSYKINRSEGVLFKQALLNGIVIWEDDVAGDEEWQQIQIPITLDQGKNRLDLRLYAKEWSKNFPVTVWMDDVKIEPVSVVTKEKSTSIYVFDSEGDDTPPTDLYLGETTDVSVRVENNEGSYMDYVLQVRLNGYTLKTHELGLGDGTDVWQNISFTTNQIGPLLKLEFLLFKDTAIGEPYKSVDYWVSSDINYKNMDILNEYKVTPLPKINNSDMESETSWIYNGSANFTGNYSDLTLISPSHSYKISISGDKEVTEGSYGEISQNITTDKYPAVVVVSFSVKDSYTSEGAGYISKQLLLNDNIMWEDDVAGDERWQHIKVPITLLSGSSKLRLRVYAEDDVNDFPIDVWWDDVKIEPVSEVAKKIPTEFYILDSEGNEFYPETIYFGEPFGVTAEIENNEGSKVRYILKVELQGRSLKKESIRLEDGSKWVQNISFIPETVGDDLKLEFILYKDSESGKPIRSVVWSVSSRINSKNLEPLIKYEIRPPLPYLKNEDMESQTGWLFEIDGGFNQGYTTFDSVSGNNSYRMMQYTDCKSGDYSAIYQDFTSWSYPGVVILSFNVKDSYTNSDVTNLSKQVLLNGAVVWEDDVAGSEGWQKVNLPIYISSKTSELRLHVYTYEDLEDRDISVFWDNVKLKSVSSVV